MKKVLALALLLPISVAMAHDSHDVGVNSSIHVRDGEQRDGDLTTVNGGIRIGDDATIRGDCHSVNGGIRVGRNSRVESLSSVNGGIEIEEGTSIRESVNSVNGRVTMERDTRAGNLSAVNGPIQLLGAEIERDVRTVNGGIALRHGALVRGDIVIEEPGRGWHDRRDERDPLKIEIEDGSVVEGSIINEDPDLRVEIYLRGGGRVNGRIENARVIRN